MGQACPEEEKLTVNPVGGPQGPGGTCQAAEEHVGSEAQGESVLQTSVMKKPGVVPGGSW